MCEGREPCSSSSLPPPPRGGSQAASPGLQGCHSLAPTSLFPADLPFLLSPPFSPHSCTSLIQLLGFHRLLHFCTRGHVTSSTPAVLPTWNALLTRLIFATLFNCQLSKPSFPSLTSRLSPHLALVSSLRLGADCTDL